MLLALALLSGGPDTLRWAAGVHPGPLVLSRPTVILAEPGAVLRGGGHGTVLTILAAGSVVRGLTIEGSGRDPDHYDAGVKIGADSVTLDHVTIRESLFGVYVERVREARLSYVTVTGREGGREGDRGDGISFYASKSIVADHPVISWTRDGIYFSYSDSVVVSNARVSHVRFGLHYMFSHENRFERNVFTDNAAGAVIMNSRHVSVTGNVFAWNAGSRSYGLVLQTASDPVVAGNTFVGNGVGVFFDNVIRGDFRDNLVAANWLGLELFANSENTTVAGNAMTGNTFDVSGGGAPGAYQFCRDGRGNYWSRAARDGYDLDGNGVLDTPHPASSPLAELALTRESLRPLLESPAAHTLDLAERTIPVFNAIGAVDSCPLAKSPVFTSARELPAAPAARLGGTLTQGLVGAVLTLGAAVVLVGLRRSEVPA
ncbi:MAG TPA: nitrous oxide reductase family maturation protein NosD [Gemmatimonadales bacterium]|nr:nitrous oxide reductase family maturation protein NosD [Gemmatimonadales bacterium]